jgi:hypothetical protein
LKIRWCIFSDDGIGRRANPLIRITLIC